MSKELGTEKQTFTRQELVVLVMVHQYEMLQERTQTTMIMIVTLWMSQSVWKMRLSMVLCGY